MLKITQSRQEAKDLAASIHKWKQDHIPGYNATSWANEDLPDEQYDVLHKCDTEDKWAVPLPEGYTVKDAVEKLPDGWRKEIDTVTISP